MHTFATHLVCLRPSIALTVQNRGLKYQSFICHPKIYWSVQAVDLIIRVLLASCQQNIMVQPFIKLYMIVYYIYCYDNHQMFFHKHLICYKECDVI